MLLPSNKCKEKSTCSQIAAALICLANLCCLYILAASVRRTNVNGTIALDPTSNRTFLFKNNSGNVSSNDLNQTLVTCQRYCPHRINKIYYADGPAGLGDRKVVLRDLSQLAGFLCAEVVMPPPKEHLSEDHNYGQAISEEIEWSDFINITFIQDGSPAIKSAKTLDDGINITSWSDVPAFKLSSRKYKDWLHVVSTDGRMRDDFEVIQRFSFQQPQNATIGFVWEIHKKWYPSDIWLEALPNLETEDKGYSVIQQYHKKMRPYLETYYAKHFTIKPERRKGCTYRNPVMIPSHLAMMQKRLMKRIVRYSPDNAIFGLLHLRRGDAINECDTSVEKMHEYFACSLNRTETLGKNITMLLTSDEDDIKYRQSIMELIKEYPHVTMLDADDMVWKVVREAADNGIISETLQNNYYVYEVESILRDWDNTFFKFHLVRRRTACKECLELYDALRNI
mmetsp:Transcript_13638/g.25656  ORF Transcript_13638/g.25656 Transcript_13638/m.25656 type:complete len:453 (+) Transcript_13638:240-1598(+)